MSSALSTSSSLWTIFSFFLSFFLSFFIYLLPLLIVCYHGDEAEDKEDEKQDEGEDKNVMVEIRQMCSFLYFLKLRIKPMSTAYKSSSSDLPLCHQHPRPTIYRYINHLTQQKSSWTGLLPHSAVVGCVVSFFLQLHLLGALFFFPRACN